MPDGPVAWPDAHDMLLAVHVAAGSLGLLLGPFVIWAERWPPYQSRAGAAYCWSILVVSLTALALVAFDAPALWWLVPLAVLAYGLALVGRLARDGARGRGCAPTRTGRVVPTSRWPPRCWSSRSTGRRASPRGSCRRWSGWC